MIVSVTIRCFNLYLSFMPLKRIRKSSIQIRLCKQNEKREYKQTMEEERGGSTK